MGKGYGESEDSETLKRKCILARLQLGLQLIRSYMNNDRKYIILADDDEDDRLFFEEVLADLSLNVDFEYVSNGLEVMERLNKMKLLPDMLFMDLNMPLQSGHDCLKEIRSDDRLKDLPVIIYSTSLHGETVDRLYEDGADYYICKPGDYSKLKSVIHKAILLVEQNRSQVAKNDFIINP